jgi:hypothetical protein
MDEISRDPIDHARTSRPRVGQTLKSPANFPGLLLITAGLAALHLVWCLWPTDTRVSASQLLLH